ncbi:bifunctional riboflavin kinase/FAD synthetase [Thalassotalea profundi]|uniref:Riboflavin biosynthesis protein n=1 Tax=Thalassotalea profundi TaxID=2036687 RepID=A0ABQ3IG29_9GAMM|nr:bifunctional riboflavin kinase/FAD synthetase [Thalassotalea profundi]GHE79844.1 riboflavin biosynthesis protein [Thalassotalea profundi]
MQLIRGIHNIELKTQFSRQGCVLTIGNFDGVHLGHGRVIEALVSQAQKKGVASAVMVFEPQPQELFSPSTAPARLTRLRDKYVLLKRLGVDYLICVNFNRKFANLTATDFVEQLLVNKLNIKHLIIGDDFHFGKNRLGNFSMLQNAGKEFNFSVSDTASYKLEDCRISSTEIRKALVRGDLAEAEKMLGRPYAIIGRVFHGDKRGRELGFPTANILLKRRVSPVSGVYVVKVNTPKVQYSGVANIGKRPTIDGVRQQLEVHIFDFNQSIYGEIIEVQLLRKLRDEIKFASITELTEQIAIDCNNARNVLLSITENQPH